MARARVVRSSGPRRQAAWSNSVTETMQTALGAGAALGGVAIGITATSRVTLTRIRGSAVIHLDAGAALDAMVVGLGLIVVKTEAFAIGGAASMPGPLTDVEQSWVWHHLFTLGPAVSATDDGGDISRNSRIMIDSKAQRKMQVGDTLAFVWEAVVNAGSPTIDGSAAVRTMFLLS